MPTSAAERELWTIWIGYFATYFIVVIITRLLIYCEVMHANPAWGGHAYFKELLPYPFISMVSGLAFFIMGANYWGRCYTFGAAFFIAAALMPMQMTLAPLVFGVLWTVTLLMLGMRLRRQAGKSLAAGSSPSQVPTVQFRGPK